MKLFSGQERVETITSVEPSARRHRLIKIREELDEKLSRYNPGELLSWWIAEDAFELPDKTIEELRLGGRALAAFFSVANELFFTHEWLRRRLEKKFTPAYALLNRVQPEALPLLIRPDVVLDRGWHPRLVELEISVGSRADTAIMAEQYGLDPDRGLIRAYADVIRMCWPGQTMALVTASHPFFLDLPDDAAAFASLLRREGLKVVVLTDRNLPHLRFQDRQLLLHRRDGAPIPLRIIDRFIDIYEIAELQHPGLAALLDAYLAGAVTDLNTCKQFLDEKDWMALFWEPELRNIWHDKLGAEYDGILRTMIPKTWLIKPEARVELPSGRSFPLLSLGDLAPEERPFIIKESGTSTTASGAQSLKVLSDLSGREVHDLIRGLIDKGIPYVVQETIDSPRISFTALDPDDDRMITQHGARVKLSVFYVDGRMTDIRLVASNVKLAVNDQDYVVGVVRY
ncbi:MAG: hypothetical protein ACMUIA_02650 [bacterium]